MRFLDPDRLHVSWYTPGGAATNHQCRSCGDTIERSIAIGTYKRRHFFARTGTDIVAYSISGHGCITPCTSITTRPIDTDNDDEPNAWIVTAFDGPKTIETIYFRKDTKVDIGNTNEPTADIPNQRTVDAASRRSRPKSSAGRHHGRRCTTPRRPTHRT